MTNVRDEFWILFLYETVLSTIDLGYSLLCIWLTFICILHSYGWIGPCLSDICIREIRTTVKVFVTSNFLFRCGTCLNSYTQSLWFYIIFTQFLFWMLNIAGTNSYIIHLTINNEKLLRRKYLWHLPDALMKENF